MSEVLLASDHWQVGREVRIVFSRDQIHDGKLLASRGDEPWPDSTVTIAKVARKYVITRITGPRIHEHESQWLKNSGRLTVQHGFLSIVYPGDEPLLFVDDFLPPRCCKCGEHHKTSSQQGDGNKSSSQED